MSTPDEATPMPQPDGSRTGREGTPLAVDVTHDVHNRSTLAAFVSGPVIWSAHFMAVYLIAEAGCTGDGPGLNGLDPPVPTVVTLVATAIAVVASLAAAMWNHRRWRAARTDPAEGTGLEPADRGGILAFAGFAMSLLGVIVVLAVGLPATVLPAC